MLLLEHLIEEKLLIIHYPFHPSSKMKTQLLINHRLINRHCLIVFGGQNGLEYSLCNDHSLKINDVRSLFHFYLNTCPNQGSRTIRTEVSIRL